MPFLWYKKQHMENKIHYQLHRQSEKSLIYLESAKLFFNRTCPVDMPEIEITFNSVLCLSFLLLTCSCITLILLLFDIFPCHLERNDNFYPLSGFSVPQHTILLCWRSHSADSYKSQRLSSECSTNPKNPASHWRGSQRPNVHHLHMQSWGLWGSACTAQFSQEIPASPCRHHLGLGSQLGLCLHFLPSSKVCPVRSAAAKLVQDIPCVRLSCAQISQAECDLWGSYIHTCIHTHILIYIQSHGNYPTTHKRSRLENHATTGPTPRSFWFACLSILRHEGIICIF